ncbi:hypothetical protein ABZ905_16925 [Streptomyces parvus]|uniref:hypothetical protein n=1 Tax=Streptomyces parvus TaxID=66428 RepID=UPI0033F8EDD5
MQDLLVLGCEAGESLGAEVGELLDGAVRSGKPDLELGDLRLEPLDLGVPRVGDVSGGSKGLQAVSELLSEVGVGAGSILLRRKRAQGEHWLGEVDGIDSTLTFLRAKQAEAARLVKRLVADLGIPRPRPDSPGT